MRSGDGFPEDEVTLGAGVPVRDAWARREDTRAWNEQVLSYFHYY